MTITLFGGELLKSADNRGVTATARSPGRARDEPLLHRHPRRMTGAKSASAPARGGGKTRRGGVEHDRAHDFRQRDLETGFQLAYLLLTEPRIEESAFAQFQTTTKQFLQEALKTPGGLGGRVASSLPYPDDDPRTKPVTPEQIDRLTLAAAQAWLEKLIRESPIEIAIVGDLPQDRALDLAARYLGALPSRARVGPDTHLALRTLKPRRARVRAGDRHAHQTGLRHVRLHGADQSISPTPAPSRSPRASSPPA